MQPRNKMGVARRMSERARAAQDGGEAAGLAGDLAARLRHVFEQIAQAAGSASSVAGERDGDQGPAEPRGGQAGSKGVDFTLGGRPGRVVFGYSVSMGQDGMRAEPFGDVPAATGTGRGKARTQAPAARAPIVDVFEEESGLRIVAELPGVAASDVTCRLDGQTLQIATGGAHRYGKTVALPAPVDPASLTQSCHNGILEIRLTRAAA